jgi:hypothetical protein
MLFFSSATSRRSKNSSSPKSGLSVESLESRLVPYTISGNAWPNPQVITISFVPDGTNLGGVSSNLFASFNAKWATKTWENQILKAAQAWAQQANVNFVVVSDSGAPIGSSKYEQGDPCMGDIRIGGYNFGTNSLAAAYQPPPINNYSIAGDMQFNTAQPYNIGATYDLFTVASHEFGHALGMYHSTLSSAMMYSAYTGQKTALNSDDIAGIQAIYGARPIDVYDTGAGDHSFQTAADITSRINSSSLTALVNNLDIVNTADIAYYKFTVPSGTNGSLTVQVQSAGLSLLAPTLTVYAANQSQLAFISGAGQFGTKLSTSLTGLTAGQTYYVKVAGADTSAFGTGAYSLSLNFGTCATPNAASPCTPIMSSATPTAGGGLPDKVGEFLVNTATGYQEQASATAMAPDGRSVVVWQSQNQDGSGHWGIYAQRFTASGVAAGGEFRVNTCTQDDKTLPSVAMASDGSFVVTWQSHNQDGNGWGVYAQRYDANGNPLGGEFRVNTFTNNDQMAPSVAVASDGSFVIAWQSNGQDAKGWGVYAQRYDSNGNALGGEFRVNSWMQDDQTAPSVAMAADDSFVVTWQSHNQESSGHWGIFAQRYSATGAAVGGELRVNTWSQDDTISAKVAMAGVGSFVITWQSHGEDGAGWGVYAQRYDANANPLGSEFRANTWTQDDQMAPDIAMSADGNFVIAWQSHNQDGNGWGIYAQRFDEVGVAQGHEFLVNTTTTNDQMAPSVAKAADGSFFITWQSNNQNSKGWGIFGQRYTADGDLDLSRGAGDAFAGREQVQEQAAAVSMASVPTSHVQTRILGTFAFTVQPGCSPLPANVGGAGAQPAIRPQLEGMQGPAHAMASAIGGAQQSPWLAAVLDWVDGLSVPSEDILFSPPATEEIAPACIPMEMVRDASHESSSKEMEVLLNPIAVSAHLGGNHWQQACEAFYAASSAENSEREARLRCEEAGAADGEASCSVAGLAVALFASFCPSNDPLAGRNRRHAGLLQSERRLSIRFPCHLNAACRQIGTGLGEGQTAIAGNLSLSGVLLILSRPFLPGSVLTLEFNGSTKEPTRRLLCRVVHVAEQGPGRWQLGCAFNRPFEGRELQHILLGPKIWAAQV